MSLIYVAEQEMKRLMQEAKALKRELQKEPKGWLTIHGNVKYQKWFRSFPDRTRQQYIPKSKRSLAEMLALKTLQKTQFEEKEQQYRALAAYMKAAKEIKSLQMMKPESQYYELLKTQQSDLEKELDAWMKEEYPRYEEYKGQKKVRAETGEKVRSKSEAIILGILHRNRIPFRYECELDLGGEKVHPDFMIRHPRSGQVFLWEHLGKMDDPAYVERNLRKIRNYINAGWIPMKNLILTFETDEDPMDAELATLMVSYFFL